MAFYLACNNGALAQVVYSPSYTVSTFNMYLQRGGVYINQPTDVAVDGSGNIYVLDGGLVKLSVSGEASSINPSLGTNKGPLFETPIGITVDTHTNLFCADFGLCSITEISPVGTNWVATTIAGGGNGFQDGVGTSAKFNGPVGIVPDNAGNLYVSDYANNALRKLTPAGTNWIVTTLTSSTGILQVPAPQGLAIDRATNIYFAVTAALYEASPAGTNWILSTIAGNPAISGSNDGVGSAARFNNPAWVALDASTNLYVSDTGNRTIRKIIPVGTNWVVTTLAGVPGSSGFDDGVGSSVRFSNPIGLAMDRLGALYIADFQTSLIRRGFPTFQQPVIATNYFPVGFSNGDFSFVVTAAAGQTVVVDSTPDLQTWTPVWTNTIPPAIGAGGPSLSYFVDSQPGSGSNRFYRARLQ